MQLIRFHCMCRDPNSVETLDVFNRSVQWAMDGSFTEQDVDEAKLSVFSQVQSCLLGVIDSEIE